MQYDNRQRDRARELRITGNEVVSKLWEQLRNRNTVNFKFRREHPLGPYVADFYCAAAKVVIELDGSFHAEQREHDAIRDEWMKVRGITVLRFKNSAVNEELNDVLGRIREVCTALIANPSPPAPLPGVPERGEPNQSYF